MNEALKNEINAKLNHLKRMENQTLKEIGIADAKGLKDLKRAKMEALEAIRKELKRLEALTLLNCGNT